MERYHLHAWGDHGPLLPLPLPPVTPSSPSWSAEDGGGGGGYGEERNSYEHAESAPYISSQVRPSPRAVLCLDIQRWCSR